VNWFPSKYYSYYESIQFIDKINDESRRPNSLVLINMIKPKYKYIDPNKIIEKMILGKEKDIYLYEDSHLSNKSYEQISKEIINSNFH